MKLKMLQHVEKWSEKVHELYDTGHLGQAGS